MVPEQLSSAAVEAPPIITLAIFPGDLLRGLRAVGAAEAGPGVGVAGVDGAEVLEEEGAVEEGGGGALGATEYLHS